MFQNINVSALIISQVDRRDEFATSRLEPTPQQHKNIYLWFHETQFTILVVRLMYAWNSC